MTLAITGTFEALLRFYALLAVITNIGLVVALFVLRRREPLALRPFGAWGYPVAPALLLIIDVAFCVLFVSTDGTSAVGAIIALTATTAVCVVGRRLFRADTERRTPAKAEV